MKTSETNLIESSKDYGNNSIIIHFEGEKPSEELLIEFLKNSYDCSSFVIEDCVLPDALNCGTVYIKVL